MTHNTSGQPFGSSEPDVGLQDDPLFNPQWEEQFVLRVPPNVAEKLRKKSSAAEFSWTDARFGHMTLDGEKYPMRLVDLPCVTETHKTIDKVTFYKTGDIGQMIIVSSPNSFQKELKEQKLIDKNQKKYSGLTPPTFEIQKRVWPKQCNVNLSFYFMTQNFPEVSKLVSFLFCENNFCAILFFIFLLFFYYFFPIF